MMYEYKVPVLTRTRDVKYLLFSAVFFENYRKAVNLLYRLYMCSQQWALYGKLNDTQ